MLTLVTGLSAMRNLLGLELPHLGLQSSAEGGPHIARFFAGFKPYKLGLPFAVARSTAHFARRRSPRRYAACCVVRNMLHLLCDQVVST